MSARHGRRDFHKSPAALTLTGPTLARLELVEEVLAGELDAVGHRPRSAMAWEALRDRYMLGPDVVYL